jgi:hypothetical protein
MPATAQKNTITDPMASAAADLVGNAPTIDAADEEERKRRVQQQAQQQTLAMQNSYASSALLGTAGI